MKKRIALIICGALLALAGCGAESEKESGLQMEPIPAAESVQETEAAQDAETSQDAETTQDAAENTETAGESKPTRKDGERFEGVIMLEGDEQSVQYEHAVNDSLGIEIDFDYDALDRKSESDKESFISNYEDPSNPENFLEVTYRAENAEAVIASISEELSKDYDISTDTIELDNVETCTTIDALNGAGGAEMPRLLQTVYIIPAGDGTIVGTAHFTIESAEGFGHLFAYMMNTIVVNRN